MARRQHGVLARRDLEALGFSKMAIDHRLTTGRLHLISRGIYAVGRPELTRRGRWMAAVLACGDASALSHRSAAALWGIGREGDVIDVSIRRRSKIRRSGIKVRSRPSLPSGSLTKRFGIPVTDPVQTLLDRHAFRLSASGLEVLFRPLALAAHLPVPLTKQWILGYETDFFFPDHHLIVETDGLRYHRTPRAAGPGRKERPDPHRGRTPGSSASPTGRSPMSRTR